MAITRTPMVDDDGTGTTGTVINNAWKQQFYDQIDAALVTVAPPGAWTQLGYNGAVYSAASGTWTVEAGDFLYYRYVVIGKTVIFCFGVQTSTTSAATADVRIALPAGIVPNAAALAVIRGIDAGAGQAAYAVISWNVPYVACSKFSGTWAAQTNALAVAGEIVFEAQ